MSDKSWLDARLRTAWYDLCQVIDDAREKAGYEAKDEEFIHLVNAWFGDGAHDAWLEWFEDDD